MSAPSSAKSHVVGVTGSVGFHVVLAIFLGVFSVVPESELEFEIPMEIELGMSDEMVVDTTAIPEPLEEPETEAAPEEGAGVDAGRPDAGPPDAGVDAGTDAGALVAEEEEEGPSRIPPGAQLAIRLDMALVRASPLAPDVRRLLDAIPDWHLILDGSGIDPIDDLDRLLIASPNLRREQLVMAGRHAHADRGTEFIRETVTHFAEAQGTRERWRTQDGVPVADWPNEDETARVLAIVGPRHFTISRPEDLPRMLGIAAARAERAEEDETEAGQGADALLSMGEGEAFSFEVEGARNFVRGRDEILEFIPDRMRVAFVDEGEIVRVVGLATFADEEKAEAAREHWEAERARFDTFATRLFAGSALRSMTLERDGRRVRMGTTLTHGVARTAFAYAQGMLEAQARRRGFPPRPREPAPETQETPETPEMAAEPTEEATPEPTPAPE